jgi:hypothetical protein
MATCNPIYSFLSVKTSLGPFLQISVFFFDTYLLQNNQTLLFTLPMLRRYSSSDSKLLFTVIYQRSILPSDHPDRERFVFANVSVLNKDLQRLEETGWLNDSIIDVYCQCVSLLNLISLYLPPSRYLLQRANFPDTVLACTWVCNTFYWDHFIDTGTIMPWTIVDLTKIKYLFIPLNDQ